MVYKSTLQYSNLTVGRKYSIFFIESLHQGTIHISLKGGHTRTVHSISSQKQRYCVTYCNDSLGTSYNNAI